VGDAGVGGACGLNFGSAADTNLYRSAANVLKTDGQFYAVSYISAFQGTANETTLGQKQIIFGGDTNLYRSAAGTLKTDGALLIGSSVRIEPACAGGLITLGGDANLYRSAAGILSTDGQFRAGSSLYANIGTANQIGLAADGRLYFHNSGDTSIYRSAAAVLKSDGRFTANEIGAGVYDGVPSGTPKRAAFYDHATRPLRNRKEQMPVEQTTTINITCDNANCPGNALDPTDRIGWTFVNTEVYGQPGTQYVYCCAMCAGTVSESLAAAE
jgi:hypothetical protein